MGTLPNNTTGNLNVTFGVFSSYGITTGACNTAVGSSALGTNVTGNHNVAVGYGALYLTRGIANIGIGHYGGSSISTGSYNVVIGGNDGSTIATTDCNVILSDGLGNIRLSYDAAGVGTSPGDFDVGGALTAVTKSFLIKHPTKENMKLRYGSLEGPENGVYIRGRLSGVNTIELPDYWLGLVDSESITVSLTPIRKGNFWVDDIIDNTVIVGSDRFVDCFYTIFAERNDVDKLEVEISNGK
jgi:hypothetical protein